MRRAAAVCAVDLPLLHPAFVRRVVREVRADLGISLDGDADRCVLADERGHIIDGDQVMALVARRWHEAGLHTGAQVRSGDARKDGSTERRLDSEEQAAIARMLREG